MHENEKHSQRLVYIQTVIHRHVYKGVAQTIPVIPAYVNNTWLLGVS